MIRLVAALTIFASVLILNQAGATPPVGPATLSELCLRGTVREEATHRPLRGAQVSIWSLNRGVLTDSTGAYQFCALPPGEYTVQVALIGYYTERRDVALHCPGGLIVGPRRCDGEETLNFFMRVRPVPFS